MKSIREVKAEIAKAMNDRKKGISVAILGSTCGIDEIAIKYPRNIDYISLNPISDILKESGFVVAQILNFMESKKTFILLVRYPKRE